MNNPAAELRGILLIKMQRTDGALIRLITHVGKSESLGDAEERGFESYIKPSILKLNQ